MRDRRRLPGCTGGGHCGGSLHTTSCAASHKSVANLSGNVELTTSKGACPRNGITRTAVAGRFRLEQSQHPLRTVCRPRRDDTTVSLA